MVKRIRVEHQLNINHTFGPAWLGLQEETPLEGYFQSQVNVGYTPLLWRHDTRFPGGPTVELVYNHLSGNETVQGSNSDSFGLRAGLDQRLWTYGFMRAVVGLRANVNRLDLGFGLPLEEKTALDFNAAISLGGQYCFRGRQLCVGGLIEGYYSRTLAGGMGHHNAGVVLGPAFTFGVVPERTIAQAAPQGPQRSEHEITVRVTTDEQVARLEKRVGELETENRALSGQRASLAEQLTRTERVHQFDPYRRVILFNEGSATLPTEARYNPPGQKGDQDPSICKINCSPELELILNYMKDNLHRIEKIVVHGHTSQTGQAEQDNKVLSEVRAKVVAEYLMRRGVPKEIIEMVSHGSRLPTTPGQSGEWDQRVEIEIIWKKEQK